MQFLLFTQKGDDLSLSWGPAEGFPSGGGSTKAVRPASLCQLQGGACPCVVFLVKILSNSLVWS